VVPTRTRPSYVAAVAEERAAWRTFGERTIYDNRWVRLGPVDMEAPNGERWDYHVVHLAPIAIALIVNDADEVLMLWRYRFATAQWGDELLGGLVDVGEEPATTAAREAAEESGWARAVPPQRLPRHEHGRGRVGGRGLQADGVQAVDRQGELFREIVEGVSRNSDTVVDRLTAAFGDAPIHTRDELETTLGRVARVYLDEVLQPHVLSLRRLIIAEAEQFPDLAAGYYEQAPSHGIDVIATRLAPYVDSGLLAADDLRLAAAQFACLALSVAQDRVMFIPTNLPTARERDRLAAAAARTVVAAHGTTVS
jgi:TetR/AcrR family transcriptional repressor of mexJK operon